MLINCYKEQWFINKETYDSQLLLHFSKEDSEGKTAGDSPNLP